MIFNKLLDILLLKFPIYLPILYGVILYSFPDYDYVLVFITLLLLAEPHFGATWPFLVNRVNSEKLLSKKIHFLFAPIIIVILSFIGYFYFNFIFLLIFFIYNLYHVTKQSLGISKLFIKNEKEIEIQTFFIYVFNFLFLLIGLSRFYLGFNNGNITVVTTLIVSICILLSILYYTIKFGANENVLTLITGIVIFLPVCFVSQPIHGIIMGVTMHYVQYLALTYKITLGRRNEGSLVDQKSNYTFVIIIFLYGLIMAVLSSANQFQITIFEFLIVIPIIGQLLHFYLDGFLWKFSDKHHRNVTLKYIKS